MTVKGTNIELEGKALTNDDVVEFVNNLRRTDYFSNIRLLDNSLGDRSKLSLYQFKLNMTLKV